MTESLAFTDGRPAAPFIKPPSARPSPRIVDLNAKVTLAIDRKVEKREFAQSLIKFKAWSQKN